MASAVLALLAASAFQTPAIEPDLDIVLGTARLNTKNARFDPNLYRLFRQGHFTTPLYDSIYENPWRAPIFAENIRRELSVSANRPQDTLASMARLLGIQTRRSLVGNPNAEIEESSKKPGALKSLLETWKAKGWLTGSIPNLGALPEGTQSAAALVLGAVPSALEFRRLALLNVGDVANVFTRFAKQPFADASPSEVEFQRSIGDKIDLAYMAAGGFDLAAASQEATHRIATVDPKTRYEAVLVTKWGKVVLTGGSDSMHNDTPTLLAIDTGGNDTYLNLPATKSANDCISVVLDGAGTDKYLSDPSLSNTSIEKWAQRKSGGSATGPGSALLGYSMIFDRDGDDLYRSHRMSFGSARFGIACVVDTAGNDVYDAYADSIGFAKFGLGWIDDADGKDQYLGFSQVQACGQTMGVGVVIDRRGDDAYLANDTVLDYPSAQSAEHNSNMSQGVGNGRRGDYIDGHSLAGGIGILLDLEGADRYTCGVFGQGVGYWEGVGMLLDTSGDDTYSGQWYAQGASAHYAIGYLEDEAGNDSYLAPINMAQGAGHDFGLGVLIDRLGNDKYTAPNLSLGAGNANGIGWFLDGAGSDTYASSGISLGSAAEAPKTSLRIRALCLGVFMDLGGDDTYPPASTWAKNATRSAQIKDRGPNPEESQLGVFWDR